MDNSQVPFYLVLISTLVNNSIIFAVVVFLGLLIAPKVDLGLPILEGWLKKEKVKNDLKSILPLSVGMGILAGALIVALDLIFSPIGTSSLLTNGAPPPWQGLLSSFYGGINEEVLMRLFVMSFLVYLTFRVKKTNDGKPTAVGVWFSIVMAALLFGAGHLPTVMALGPLTSIKVGQVLLLNGVGGIIFGWLYWKKGLESAMISHFTADLVLHVLVPLFTLGI
jgi:hypothetical protein